MQVLDLTAPPGHWPLFPPIPAEEIGSGTPEQRGIEVFSSPEDGLTVGLWSCTPYVTVRGPYPVDEFMVLLEGTVIIRLPDGQSETLRAGDSFFIPKGLNCVWDQPETVKKVYVIFENGMPSKSGFPLRVDLVVALSASPSPAAAVLVGAAPTHQAKGLHEDASGQFSVGVWATTPYVRIPIPYPRHELMHLLAGEVTLTAGGVTRTWTAGETCFVPKGCVVDWVSRIDVRKIYCSIVPKAVP